MRKIDPNIVIVGGGFAGLSAARILGSKGVRTTIIDRNNYHLFQPLLYQVATGFLAPGDIAAPIRSVLARYKNTSVIQDEVIDLIPDCKEIVTKSRKIRYDYLVVATGVTHSYFGNEEWEEHAPGLKTIEDAISIRSRVLRAFELAEVATDPVQQKALLHFLIVGGGPTGVELAGTLAELSRATLKGEFRNIDPTKVTIELIESGPTILSTFHKTSSQYTESTLRKLGVGVRTGEKVTLITKDYVEIQKGSSKEQLPIRNVIWAAGVKASSLSGILKERLNVELDRTGRVVVNENLLAPNNREIYVVGDLAHVLNKDGTPVPGVAPAAIQQGAYVAKSILSQIQGKAVAPFTYFDKGSMAVIGRGRAVAESARLRTKGFVAWVAWAIIHIYYLIEFENKFIVFFHWAWNYISNKRGSRLITRE